MESKIRREARRLSIAQVGSVQGAVFLHEQCCRLSAEETVTYSSRYENETMGMMMRSHFKVYLLRADASILGRMMPSSTERVRMVSLRVGNFSTGAMAVILLESDIDVIYCVSSKVMRCCSRAVVETSQPFFIGVLIVVDIS